MTGLSAISKQVLSQRSARQAWHAAQSQLPQATPYRGLAIFWHSSRQQDSGGRTGETLRPAKSRTKTGMRDAKTR